MQIHFYEKLSNDSIETTNIFHLRVYEYAISIFKFAFLHGKSSSKNNNSIET